MQHVVSIKSSVCGGLWGKLPTFKLDVNVSFLQAAPGAVKLAHTLLGMICLSVIAHYCQMFHPLTGKSLGFLCSNSAAFFLLVTYGCFVTSLIIITASLFSYFTASFLPKTAFEFGYHLMSCILYLSSSINLLVTLLVNFTEKGSFKEPGYDAKIAASVLGMINGILYGASTFFSFQAQKQMS